MLCSAPPPWRYPLSSSLLIGSSTTGRCRSDRSQSACMQSLYGDTYYAVECVYRHHCSGRPTHGYCSARSPTHGVLRDGLGERRDGLGIVYQLDMRFWLGWTGWGGQLYSTRCGTFRQRCWEESNKTKGSPWQSRDGVWTAGSYALVREK